MVPSPARQQPAPMPPRRQRGFTAIEMLVATLIGAVLLGLALPAFAALIQTHRLSGEIYGFATDLQFARAEAVRRGAPVSVCLSADGQRCAESGDWSEGWIVFTDADGDQAPASAEHVLLQRGRWSSSDSLRAHDDTTAYTFSRDGYLLHREANSHVALDTVPPNPATTRCMTLNLAGEQRLRQGAECRG